jgi:spermidine/putrescine transport system substrate-binding protein
MKHLRMLWSVLLICLVALPLAAQDATPEATAEAAVQKPTTKDELAAFLGWSCPSEFAGQTLSVYNWAFYVAEDTVSNFALLCDVTVNYDVYESNEAMIARLRNGNPGYDVIVPSNYVIPGMAEDGLLTPIDASAIPNLANVNPLFLNPDYDPNNQYTVPYMWGTVGVAYNVNAVSEPITSWQQVFDHDGAVAWLEDMRAMLSIGLVMQGFDPNSTNPDEIAAARDFLIENSSNVVTLVVGNSQQLLSTGEVDLAIDYNGNAFQLNTQCACEDYALALPDEGFNIFIDNIAIPADAPNAALAQVFLDYMMLPQVSADISNYLAYATPNQVALDEGLVAEAIATSTIIYPNDETIARGYVTTLITPEEEQLYIDAWDEVKINIGQ